MTISIETCWYQKQEEYGRLRELSNAKLHVEAVLSSQSQTGLFFFSPEVLPLNFIPQQSQESCQIRGLESAGVMRASADINIGKEKK